MPCSLAWLVHGLNSLKKKSDFSRNPGLPTVHPLLEGSMASCLLHLPSVPAHSAQRQEKAAAAAGGRELRVGPESPQKRELGPGVQLPPALRKLGGPGQEAGL